MTQRPHKFTFTEMYFAHIHVKFYYYPRICGCDNTFDLLCPCVRVSMCPCVGVGVCVCLSCSCSNVWKHWPRNFIFWYADMFSECLGYFCMSRSTGQCQGHRSKEMVDTSVTIRTFAGGAASINPFTADPVKALHFAILI